MSNRTIKQASALAELRMAHEAQIEALTVPGLTDEERVRRFGEAAGFDIFFVNEALGRMRMYNESSSTTVWLYGQHEHSLFGDLPDCMCPVMENRHGRATYLGIPDYIPDDWQPDRATLEAFARVQQEARFPDAR